MALYPLLLTPIYKEKVWGGRSLERLGHRLPGGPDTRIGESWELADIQRTSVSGGGGEPAHSVIRNGPLLKRTFGEVVRDFGALVTGSLALRPDGSFPLLLKYLDARENLSVQVHPSAAYAAEHEDADLKSEALYIVDADPGAVMYRGLRDGTTAEQFRQAVEEGGVEDLLEAVPARAGDCHYLPGGTVHALGAGIVVAEVQTTSDTTYRVYDWGRTDRELHLEQALECIEWGPWTGGRWQPDARTSQGDAACRLLVDCEHFNVSEWTLLRRSELRLESDELSILMIVSGTGSLTWGDREPQSLPVGPGDTVVLPAALSWTAVVSEDDLKLLEIRAAMEES